MSLTEEPFVPVVVEGCEGAANLAAWDSITNDLAIDVNVCAGLKSGCTTISAMDDVCVSDCMASTYGFTPDCAVAFGNLAKCGFDNCKLGCASGVPDSKSCVKCNENKCDP